MSRRAIQRRLGERIRQLREERGLTREDLDAEKKGIPVRTLADIERGVSNVTLDSLYRISRMLRVEIRELFDFDSRLDSKQ